LSQHDTGGYWQFILGSVHPPEIILKDDLGIDEHILWDFEKQNYKHINEIGQFDN
jgi:hypothetical protein